MEGELISIADLITTNTELVQFDITKCEFGASDLTPLVKAIFKSKNLTTSNLPAVFKDFQIGRVLAVKSKLLTIYKNAVASCLKLRQEINSDNNIYVIDVRTHIFQILASFEATIKRMSRCGVFDYVADLRREFSDVFGFLEPSIKSEPTISKTQSDPSKDYAFVHPISTSSVLHSLNNNNNSSTIEKTHSCLKVSGLNQSNKSDLKYKIYLQKAEVNKIEFWALILHTMILLILLSQFSLKRDF
ncbi:MAG: hypothetical protein HWD59_08530 [Coxiellaceae bacterium]|nr:MAG: hypothetical protein HWD59_08530 [Coxiellaceae bacterium]